MYARDFSAAARPPPHPGQTNPFGQRRSYRNAPHVASSGKASWNSVSDRALAIGGPFALPSGSYRRHYHISGYLGQRDQPLPPSPVSWNVTLVGPPNSNYNYPLAVAATVVGEYQGLEIPPCDLCVGPDLA